MRKKPSEEELKLYKELTSGEAGGIFLMAIELDGKETSCIFAYNDIPEEERVIFTPIAVLMTDEIAEKITLPDGIDELKLPDFFKDDEEDTPNLNLN